MEQNKYQVLPGTLNLMILKTLETPGPAARLWDCQAH